MGFRKGFTRAALLSLAGLACAGAATRDSVVGHWNFLNIRNDTILDLSGNGNHGKVSNTLVHERGREFGAPRDSVVIRDNETFHLTRSFTIEAFCEITGFPTGENNYNHAAVFYRADSRMGRDPMFLAVEPTQRGYDQQWLRHIRFHVESDPVNCCTGDDVGVMAELNVPLHIVAIMDDEAGKMALWINGEKKAEKSTGVRSFGPLDGNSGPGVSLGSHPYSNTYQFPFIGIIEEIRLLKYAMSEQEIRDRHGEGPAVPIAGYGARHYEPMIRAPRRASLDFFDAGSAVLPENLRSISGKRIVPENRWQAGVFIVVPE